MGWKDPVRSVFAIALLLAFSHGASAMAAAADWAQWLGPGRDGISPETGLLKTWSEGQPRTVWKRELGDGFSAVTASDGRLYTMYGVGRTEFLACLDAASGKTIWKRWVGVSLEDGMGGDGPRSTPTVHGGVVYTLGSRGMLIALDASDGAVRWRRDLVSEFGGVLPKWGYCQSPLLWNGRLFVDVGGAGGHGLMAFEAAKGRVAWRSGDVQAGYSSPVAAKFDGVPQILFFTGHQLVSAAPGDGALLWSVPWKTSYDVNAATPLILGSDRVFIASGYGTGGAVYQVTRTDGRFGAQELWRRKTMKNKMSTSILHDGHLYGFDEDRLACVDAATGQRKWSQKGFQRGSLIYADGRLIVLGEDCDLALADATPDGYRERGKRKVLGDVCWTVPTVSKGRLYLRDQDHMMSLDIAAQAR